MEGSEVGGEKCQRVYFSLDDRMFNAHGFYRAKEDQAAQSASSK